MSRYKIIPRHAPGWRLRTAATLGVSVSSPNWHDERFASILAWAAEHFAVIRIDVTDTLYRHNFMAEGLDAHQAEARATALGALWLVQHQDIIDACPVTPRVIRWAEWYTHPDYPATLAGFERAYDCNPVLREAVEHDISEFYRRQHRQPSREEHWHGKNYLLEEIAVTTLQERALPSAKIYPGDELACMHVVRRGLVPEAPLGLERQLFVKIKFHERGPVRPLDARTGPTQARNAGIRL